MKRRLPSTAGHHPSTLCVIRRGGQRFRIGAWRADPGAGYLAPLGPLDPTPSAALSEVVHELLDLGFDDIVTSALSAKDYPVFAAVGFEVVEELHLLSCPLSRMSWWQRRRRPTIRPGVALRQATDADRTTVLELDCRAFDGFWQLDDAGLDEALEATSSARYQVALDPEGVIIGYAVTGATTMVGYLQRLAVDPDHHGEGVGRILVEDALDWCRRRGERTVMVNTQLRNQVALQLYLSCGFELQADRLMVMRRPGPTTANPATARSAHPAAQPLDT